MYRALLDASVADDALPRPTALRTAISGGEPLPRDLPARFDRHFGVGILEGYGLSETSLLTMFNQCGRPVGSGPAGASR
ncbi:AMP-binding protein [Streptomycetaceae bacterium NBC_01309]